MDTLPPPSDPLTTLAYADLVACWAKGAMAAYEGDQAEEAREVAAYAAAVRATLAQRLA